MNPQSAFLRKSMLLVAIGFALTFSSEPLRLAAQQPKSGAVSTDVKLKKEIESLAGFEGKWACQGVFPSSGKPIESQILFAPDLEGAWLSVRHDDLPPNRFHAAEYWGFDPAEKQLIAFIYDSFGGARKFTSPGWTEDKLVWTGETAKTDPPVTQRFVFRRDSPSQFVMNYEVKKGAADWVIGDTITCRK
jgi:hypothetical protein